MLLGSFFISLLLGCGGGGGGGTTGSSVSIVPAFAAPAFGQQVAFRATVNGIVNQTVTWTATGGTIASTSANTATYTAPGVAGNYTITARSDADNTVIGTCIASVSAIGVTVSPAQATVGTGRTLNFSATVTGATNLNVTWTATGGSIVSTGVGTARFTAPGTIGTYTITARSVENSARFGQARVTTTTVAGNNAIINGRVINQQTGVGLPNIGVVFYDNANNAIAQYTTNVNGNFSGQVSILARRVHIANSTLGNNLYKAYEYDGLRFSTLVATCTAALPTLVAGSTVTLPTNFEIPPTSAPPPPPPNGCQ